MKIKERDQGIFNEILKSLLSFKKEEISHEKLINKFEDLLFKYSDLLEESYLFLDLRKVIIFTNYHS